VTPDALACDLDLEHLVLGLIQSSDAAANSLPALTQDHFSIEQHRRIFCGMAGLPAR
jgi:hypothetical protein